MHAKFMQSRHDSRKIILIGWWVHWSLSRYEEVEDYNKDPCVRLFFAGCFLLLPREKEKPDTQARVGLGWVWRAVSQAVFYHNCYRSHNLIGGFAVVDKSPDNAARALVQCVTLLVTLWKNLKNIFFWRWYRMWFSIVCTFIDNDMRHDSGQNLLWLRLLSPQHFGSWLM